MVGGRSLTVGGPSNYLPFKPIELLHKGFYKRNVRLLTGVVKDEGTFLTISKCPIVQTQKESSNRFHFIQMVSIRIIQWAQKLFIRIGKSPE